MVLTSKCGCDKLKSLVNQISSNTRDTYKPSPVTRGCGRLPSAAAPRTTPTTQRRKAAPAKKHSLFLEQKRLKLPGYGAAPRPLTSPGLRGNAPAFRPYKRNKLDIRKEPVPKAKV